MSKKDNLKAANDALRLMASALNSKERGTMVPCLYDVLSPPRQTRLGAIYPHREQYTAFGIVKDGKAIFCQYSSCYGFLSFQGSATRPSYLKGTDLIFTRNPKMPETLLARRDQRKLFSWFLKESPWSKVILTNSPTFAQKYGIVVDADAPANLVGSALLAFRQFRGFGDDKIKLWFDLVKKGVHKNLAAILVGSNGSYIKRQKGSGRGYSQVMSDYMFIHGVVEGFLNGETLHKTGTYKELAIYRNIPPFGNDDSTVLQTFCKLDNANRLAFNKFNREFFEFVDKYRSKKKKSTIPQPTGFGAPTVNPNVIYMPDALPAIAKWAKKTFPKHHA